MRNLQNMGISCFLVALRAVDGSWPSVIQASRSHSDTHTTPHSVGFPWTNDQPDAETSTSKHRILTRYRNPCSAPPPPGGRIRTRSSSKRAAAGPWLRPRDHWDRQMGLCAIRNYKENLRNIIYIIYNSCQGNDPLDLSPVILGV